MKIEHSEDGLDSRIDSVEASIHEMEDLIERYPQYALQRDET